MKNVLLIGLLLAGFAGPALAYDDWDASEQEQRFNQKLEDMQRKWDQQRAEDRVLFERRLNEEEIDANRRRNW